MHSGSFVAFPWKSMKFVYGESPSPCYYFPPCSYFMVTLEHLANSFIQQPVSTNEECGFGPKSCVILQGSPRLCVGGISGENRIPLTRLTALPGHASLLEEVLGKDCSLTKEQPCSYEYLHSWSVRLTFEVSWGFLWDTSQVPAQSFPLSWVLDNVFSCFDTVTPSSSLSLSLQPNGP